MPGDNAEFCSDHGIRWLEQPLCNQPVHVVQEGVRSRWVPIELFHEALENLSKNQMNPILLDKSLEYTVRMGD